MFILPCINIFKQYWKIVKKSTQFLLVKGKRAQLCFFVEHNHIITSLSICVGFGVHE